MSSVVNRVLQRRDVSEPTLTSRQQFTVLDMLVENALRPIQAESEVFLTWVAEILDVTIKSRRRNAAEMQLACAAVLSGAPDAITLLVNAGLDRTHVFAMLERVRTAGEPLIRAERVLATGEGNRARALADSQRARDVLGDSPRLVPALTESAYWLERAMDWRNGILDHYVRFLYKNAAGMNRASGGRIELEPTFHDAWVAAAGSVHRFRSDQATFAGFLGRSLMGTYRIAASHALGLAAPGARVTSADALQTTVMDDAMELADPKAVTTDSMHSTLRAIQLASTHPDVRAALMVSDVSPVDAAASVGRGPLARGKD